jgi:hypothetical protein
MLPEAVACSMGAYTPIYGYERLSVIPNASKHSPLSEENRSDLTNDKFITAVFE